MEYERMPWECSTTKVAKAILTIVVEYDEIPRNDRLREILGHLRTDGSIIKADFNINRRDLLLAF